MLGIPLSMTQLSAGFCVWVWLSPGAVPEGVAPSGVVDVEGSHEALEPVLWPEPLPVLGAGLAPDPVPAPASDPVPETPVGGEPGLFCSAPQATSVQASAPMVTASRTRKDPGMSWPLHVVRPSVGGRRLAHQRQ
ncbi:hypothetical protein IQ63_16845 [Streptomyces acidiscabies]|uniref:Uncharacterized protein n=1 Tax=Streptomyces acidiscabies TaxID=42234 RepID=A0A0L0K8F7_9ACTN|nr:hypothetical protein IQ63_16845 [Streptomyces acidiscabies]